MEFRWLLGYSQVSCGLRDHFATTSVYLLPICDLSMAFHFSVFRRDTEPLPKEAKAARAFLPAPKH